PQSRSAVSATVAASAIPGTSFVSGLAGAREKRQLSRSCSFPDGFFLTTYPCPRGLRLPWAAGPMVVQPLLAAGGGSPGTHVIRALALQSMVEINPGKPGSHCGDVHDTADPDSRTNALRSEARYPERLCAASRRSRALDVGETAGLQRHFLRLHRG